MRKRIIALLLALILTVGLLPTVALAADPTAPTDETPGEDAVSFTKEVVGDKIKIEAYVNGDVETSVTTTPCDIVLVLDQSGSMGDTVNKTEYTYTEVNCTEWSYNKVREYSKNTTLYYQPCWRCGDAHRVSYWENFKLFRDDTYQIGYQCGGYWYALRDNGRDSESTSRGYVFYTGKLYTRTAKTTSTNKYQALKAAASAFLNTVSANAKQNKVDHRVAIVGFGSAGDDYYRNTEILTLKQSGDIGKNYSRLQADDYKNALVSCNTASGGINSALTDAVNALDANGATAVDLGLKMANNIFKNQTTGTYTGENARAKIVVVVTDGNPTHSDGFENDVATGAIKQAKTMKDSNTKVFTIGIALDGNKAKNFISYVSSDYPDATAWNYPGQPIDAAPKYTSYVSDAEAMKEIFSDIASEATSVSASAKLTQTAVLTDTISQYFKLPEGATKDSIEVYTSAAKFEDGAFTWDTEEKLTNANVKIDGQKIEVTGFDYTANCVTKTAKNKAGTDFGKKLVIYIPIEKDASKAQFGGYLPTNADATLNDPNGDNGDKGYKADGAHKDCTVVAPTLNGKNEQIDAGSSYSTTDLFTESQWPDGSNNAGVEMVYTIRDSNGATVATKTVPAGKNNTEIEWVFVDDKQNSNTYPTPGTYTFTIDCTVSCTNPKETTKHTAASTPVTGTITVKRTTATVTLTKTITGLSDGDKTTVLTGLRIYAKDSKNVKHELEKGATTGTYSAELAAGNYTIVETGKDVTGYDCATTGDTTFTVVADTDQSLTLTNAYTAKEYSISYVYEGNVPAGAQEKLPSTVNNVPYNSKQTVVAAPTLDGWTFSGWTTGDVTVDNDGKFTMPNKDVTFTGSWTQRATATITYVVVPNGAGTLSSYSETKYVDDTTDATGSSATPADDYRFVGWYDNPECSGTALSTDASYTPSKPEAGWADKTYYAKFESLTYTITFKTENGGTINDQTNDITHPGLTAGTTFPAVPTTKANTGYYFLGWYDESGNKVEENAFPKKVTGNATYTAKWKKYDSVTLNLTGRFQKELTSDTATLPENANSFTLNIKNDNSQTVAQAHVLNVPLEQKSSKYTGTKAFAVESGSEMTFNAAGTYIYTVAEAAGSISGMSYDDTTYTMTVEVVANEGKLTIQSATIEGGTVDTVNLLAAEGTNSITFHNEYTKPKKSINLGDLIQKDFDKKTGSEDLPTGSSYTFRVRAYERFLKPDGSYRYSDAPYLGEVVMTEFGQKNFVFNYGVITFFEHGTHEYVVEEFNDGAENVEYDSNRYLLVLNVADDLTITARNAGSLNDEVSTQSVEQTPVITFCNKYNKEKDPDKLTINFSDFVQKELTATGTKTASDVDFRVNVKGGENLISKYSEGEEEVNADANKYNTVLDVHFDSITGGTVETKKFTGNTVEIDHAGHYYFDLSEEKGTRTGVTYDETTYTLYVTVEEQAGSLVITNVHFYDSNDGEYDASQKITFHNTIDTGIDDYYPIIIPTIINKDTGMLNKTDHFAYVIGYPDGTVHPNGQITRAEVATIFFRLLRDEVRDGAFTTSNTYSDVAYGKWYNNPISTMSALGIITGYPDGTFKPNKPITRAEFAAIAARFDETQSGKSATFSDVIGHWAAKEIGIAYYNDWIKGYPDGTFKPDQNITRAEAMTLINRVLERKPESPADLLTNMNKWTDNMDTSKWYYLDVQEATNSHGYTRKTFNYELWRQMLPDPDWSRYER